MSSQPSVDQWMVRTAENYLAGPYTRDQIRQLLRENQLGPQDEVCQANQYWIYLHERDEVARQLGTDAVQWIGETTEEATLTQTESNIEEIERTERQAAAGLAEGDGSTTVIASLPSTALRLRERASGATLSVAGATVDPAASAGTATNGSPSTPLVHVSPSGHSRGRLRLLIWFVLTVSALGLALWLEMLRQS